MGKITIAELFEEAAAKNKAQYDADQADPHRIALRQERVHREIKAGLREADGSWIWRDDPEPKEDADEDEDEDELEDELP